MANSILLVEDEHKIAEVVQEYLQNQGYEVVHLDDGAQVMPWLSQHAADLVLLDVMLPNVDGLSLCRQIRALYSMPLALLTAKVEEVDRIIGWEMGADDYICKPFSLRELLARIKALLRRAQPHTPAESGWRLDKDRFQACYQGQCVELSAIECALLQTLSASPGRIYSRAQLIDSIYADHRVVSDRTIDSHVKKLRQKLAAAFGEIELIHSVYGAGYKFHLPDA